MKKQIAIIVVLSFISYGAMAQCHGQDCKEKSSNRVVNGDFENDSAGILSDYQYTKGSSGGKGGYYGIFTDASKLTTAYYCPKDHTTGSGHMMCFDGFLDGTRLAWGQTLRGLDTGRTYYMNYWVTDLGGGQDPATVHLQINGVFVTPRDTINTTVGSWEKRSLIWKSGSADSAEIRLIQYCSGNSGNNFALDDIEFYSCDTILNPPKLDLGPDKEICKGTSVTLSATLSFDSYLWDDNSKIFVRRVEQTGTYWVKVTYEGCKLSDTVEITVDSSLTVDLGSDTALCDQSLVLDAGLNNVTYKWNTGATTRSITVDTTGDYTVTVTNAKQCKDASTIHVTIGEAFTLNLGPDISGCAGDLIQIGVSDTTRTYSWNTGDTTGLIYVTDPGQYALDAYKDGCESSDQINISFNPLPEVSLGKDTAICSGENVVLDAGPGNTTYNWSTSETSRTIVVDTKGLYTVTVTDNNGCSNSDTIDLGVLALPEVSVTDLGENSFCEDDDVVLEAVSIGLNGFIWYRDKNEIENETGSSITITSTGSYYVSAMDSNGCTGSSEPVQLYINPLPVIVSHPQDVSAEPFEQVVYTVDANGNNTYQWQVDRGAGYVSAPEGSTYENTNTKSLTVRSVREDMQGYKFRCMVTSDSGCVSYSDEAGLTVILGVNDQHLMDAIRIYPNPTGGTVNIYSEVVKLEEVTLLTIEGKVLAEQDLQAGPLNTISFDGISAGSYILMLRSRANEMFRFNLMVH